MFIHRQCPICGMGGSVKVTEKAYSEYANGKLAQDAFPDLSATAREFIISGLCPDCQDAIFGGEE